jgi:hypothetical protein
VVHREEIEIGLIIASIILKQSLKANSLFELAYFFAKTKKAIELFSI